MTLPFEHTFTTIVAGPSRAGKSRFISKIVNNRQTIIFPPPENIYYCYTEWQPLYDTIKGVQFHKGILDIDILDVNKRNLLILDDTLNECDERVEQMFTRNSHHRNLSVIFVTQNLFHNNKHFRTMSLNASYLVLFKNPREANQISYLARQMYPAKQSPFLQEAFKDATSIPYGYLLIDLRQETDDRIRIRTQIFPNEQTYIYMPEQLATSLTQYSLMDKEHE